MALLKPHSEEHKIMKLVYLTISFIVFIQLFFVFYKNKSALIFPAYVLIGFKNGLRLFDFENTSE